jgi:hypothetical protein
MWFFQGRASFLVAILLLPLVTGCATQARFADPTEAVDSLVTSLRNHDESQLRKIFGDSADSLLFSGDSVDDAAHVDKFLTAYNQKHYLAPSDDGEMKLCVGSDDWPLPIPLVQGKSDGKWYFDAKAGEDEIVNRRIGDNELKTIQVCLAIVDAEHEYAEGDPDHQGMPCYAQKILSDPGKKNGLYWETAEGAPPSPLGELVAIAEGEGYSANKKEPGTPQPYHGYLFRILKGQGPNAPGGERSYLVGNKMIGGFGLIATPATYGNSGIMTFIVNQDGVVYQADLGDSTASRAAGVTVFDPDSKWEKVKDSDAAPATEPENDGATHE